MALGNLAACKSPGVQQGGHRPAARRAARDEKRRLGQAVAREERLGAEARRRERSGKPLHRLRANRLGAIERHLPGAEVQPLEILRRCLLDAELVSEIGSPLIVAPGPRWLATSEADAEGSAPERRAC